MIKDDKGIERYTLSTRMYNFIQRCKTKITKEDSMVLGILWGDVGCGKSILAQKLAYAADPTFTDIKRVAFTKEELTEAITSSKKQSVVGDEGISLIFSRACMTKEGRLMSELLAQCRQNNLFVIICIPDVLVVDKMTLSAADFIGYVWETHEKNYKGDIETRKGNFKIYLKCKKRGKDFKTQEINRLKILRNNPTYKQKKEIKYFIKETGQLIGETHKKAWYPVGEAAYLEKKSNILKKYEGKFEKKVEEKKESDSIKKMKMQRDITINLIAKILKKRPNVSLEELSEMYGYHIGTLCELRKEAQVRLMYSAKPKTLDSNSIPKSENCSKNETILEVEPNESD